MYRSMADNLTHPQRHLCMSHNKGKNTSPEMLIRRLVYSLGYRYRLHKKNLPGCPDLVFLSRKKVIFVNGCYWHRHKCKKGYSMPKTKHAFWQSKFSKTIKRDKRKYKDLKKLGWKMLVVWECQLKNIETVKAKIVNFLE